jgi:hypothetical protein
MMSLIQLAIIGITCVVYSLTVLVDAEEPRHEIKNISATNLRSPTKFAKSTRSPRSNETNATSVSSATQNITLPRNTSLIVLKKTEKPQIHIPISPKRASHTMSPTPNVGFYPQNSSLQNSSLQNSSKISQNLTQVTQNITQNVTQVIQNVTQNVRVSPTATVTMTSSANITKSPVLIVKRNYSLFKDSDL